ncbi:MAG: cyclic nucleotide-binding/CBS domain-containing protein [Candidatus Viridilinea halotolerans]|uniref:Cyclic nucleotide-binding/CBS domain-containing protein n=1 Tax=Candidatus Viridilinea halotolerans TaxID=2491704 RepID=A0A426U2Q4_9CHLR|nr:MAG: cyclic nucleotide-binding/CBS domain-containing protein [Candidatus Viridilinea halotolerans]
MDEIVTFLRSYPPFDKLPNEAAELAASQAQIEYFATGSDILIMDGPPAQFLYLIRKGTVDLVHMRTGEATVVDSLNPGEGFGHRSLSRSEPPVVTVKAHTEVLAYLVPAEIFHRLCEEYDAFAHYFSASSFDRLISMAQQRDVDASGYLFQTRVRDLIRRPPITVRPDTTVREAAQRMREENVSCLIVDLPPYGFHDVNSGIITDRDLRNRVLAKGLSYDTPLREVMTAPATSMPADSLAFEALLLMLERRIHHLPLVEDGRVIGMVTNTDILRRQSSSPLFLPRQLERARSIEDLRNYGDQVFDAVAGLLDAGASVTDVGRVVAVAHDALLQRIIRDAEKQLGAPPAPYAWLVLGSEGRYEQTLRTDQDNALVYADDHPADAPEYFSALAELVVEQLVQCGFPRCTGDILATNPRWRQPLAKWQATFARWIEVPDEEALMRAGIFFDYRQVYGKLNAEAELRPVIQRGRGNTIFLARLARAALRTPAPLTFFRGVALERRGDQKDLLDLKHRGTALIVDLARIYALEAGRSETSTVARLRAAWREASVSEVDAERMVNAFELISLIRLRSQRSLIAQGAEPSNVVVFPELSHLDQRGLKEALQAIARSQRGLSMAFQTDRLIG